MSRVPDKIKEVMEATSIDPLLLEEEFAGIASKLAYFNEQYADAYRNMLLAKARYERTEAQRSLEIRESLDDGGKKPTEATIRAHVDTDDKVIAARLHLVECESDKVRLGGVLDALRAKKDALISIGAHIRAEMGGNPSLRAEARGARDAAASRGRDTLDD